VRAAHFARYRQLRKQLSQLPKGGLGDKFSLPAFHDTVLGEGTLPLPILEQRIDRWIAQQRSRA